jgi:uncharacterized membrane protein
VNTTFRPVWIVMAIFALAGVVFAGVSTHDFVVHLDRQVHAITCSYVPGLGAADTSGTSGCHVTMMSPYSAVLRAATWGGVPIALLALSVFAFLLVRIVGLMLAGATADPAETRFVLLASLLPLVVSIGYFALSVLVLGAVCKLCVGIYVSSTGLFIAALVAHLGARRAGAAAPWPWGRYLSSFAEGTVFVGVPLVLFLMVKPAYPASVRCGELIHPEDRYGVRLTLQSVPGGVPAIEVVDPLCPACRAMRQRLVASGFDRRLALETVLFPLDNACNWMVQESVHPGACAASEAVLCAGGQAREVLAFLFQHQDELHELGRADPARVAARINAQFPNLASCMGKPEVRARLNKSLRWAVANSLPVLTPQLFVRGEKVCDEDTDLGLEYVLTRKLAAAPAGR